ncbi:MAG TPA: class I SAM-dependent methyltransferase [Myxococcales bacterium]|nr:class I SAM-dependent methyltransferase [Myxococcales bacterium]
MPVGQRVRALLGPAEPAIGRLYRGAFFDLGAFADTVRRWTDAKDILEVGCGDGLATEHLRRAFPDASITGIDIQDDVGRLFSGSREGITFRTEELDTLVARSPNSFDLVVICDVLHHVAPPARPALLRSASRALRPGGALVVKDWERRKNVAHLLAWLSDRYITGASVWFETADGLRAAVVEALGVEVQDEARFRPWRNNLAFFMRPARR